MNDKLSANQKYINLRIIIAFLLFTGVALSCSNTKEWQTLEYIENLKCDSLYSEKALDSSIKCKAYFENDTLVVYLSNLSWENIILKIHNGVFKAKLDGIPYEPVDLSFQTINQKLQLGKKIYATNDTLCGKFDLLFRITDMRTTQTNDWNFKGTICEIIRETDFDPFAKDNFMNFDFITALHEMGEPFEQYIFNTEYLTKFRIELSNYFPSSKDIIIKELTWDVSSTREISDEGIEMLTIWYARKKDIGNKETVDSLTWYPIHYMEWEINSQF